MPAVKIGDDEKSINAWTDENGKLWVAYNIINFTGVMDEDDQALANKRESPVVINSTETYREN